MTNIKLLMHIALLTPMKREGASFRWGAPFLLMGPPGRAKTSYIVQVCERMTVPCETLYLSTHQPEDLSGIPVMVNGAGNLVNFVPQINRLAARGSGVLVLDELTTARETTQNSAMGLVLERVIAGGPLPPGMRIAAAANPPEQAAAARELSLPAANRFLHFDVADENVPGWMEYMDREVAAAADEKLPLIPFKEEEELCTMAEGERVVCDRWYSAFQRTWSLVKSFHVHASGRLNVVPTIGTPEHGRAWPSSRSWDMGVRVMATATALSHPECALDLLTAAIGETVTGEYATWLATFDLPSPEDVLSGKWQPSKLRLDIAFTAYHSAVLHVLGAKDVPTKHALAIQLWGALTVAAKKYKLLDIVKPIASSLVQHGLSQKANNPALFAAAAELFKDLGESEHLAYA